MHRDDNLQLSNADERIRVLRISHSATMPAYRERERALVASGKIEIALVQPSKWEHLGGGDQSGQETFTIFSADTYLTGNIPLFAYDPMTIAKAMKWFKPHIVDCHEEPYSVSCYETLKLQQLFAPDAAFVFYSAQNINKRYPLPFRYSEQNVYRNSHGAYPCSIGVQEVLRQKGYKHQCPVIPLGVDTAQFNNRAQALFREGMDPRSFVIGFTGRLETYKGIGVLLKAVQAYNERGTHKPVSVLVCGSGNDEALLKKQAAEMNVDVRWMGAINASQMPGFYRSCDAIVVPSLTTKTWREQFGRVPVEAMACGVVTIVSDSGSLPEVVDSAAFITPEGDEHAIADAIHALISHYDVARKMVARGHTLVEQRYTWAKVAQDMQALYLRALELKHPARSRMDSERSLQTSGTR